MAETIIEYCNDHTIDVILVIKAAFDAPEIFSYFLFIYCCFLFAVLFDQYLCLRRCCCS